MTRLQSDVTVPGFGNRCLTKVGQAPSCQSMDPSIAAESNKLLKSQRLAHGIGQTIVPSLFVFVPSGLEEQQVRIVAFGVRHASTECSHQAREVPVQWSRWKFDDVNSSCGAEYPSDGSIRGPAGTGRTRRKQGALVSINTLQPARESPFGYRASSLCEPRRMSSRTSEPRLR